MIISQFFPLLGGAEVQAQQLARGLIARGIEVSVLTRRLKGLPRYEQIEGIPVYRDIRTVELGCFFGIFYLITVFMFLYKKRKEYDIIHCHIVQGFHTFVSVLFKYMFNKKVVVKMSSSGETSDLKLLREVKLGSLFLKLAGKADAIISVCKQASEEIVDSGFADGNLVEIPNGVDTNKFFPVHLTGSRTCRNVTFIGRLDRYKGVDVLIGGFKKLLSDNDKLKLTIVGSGPDERALKKMVEELGLEHNVIFRGRQENVVHELSETDIFVLPSLSEGMSNVLLEAMSCGLPVVATAVGASGEVIENECNGRLIPPGDVTSIYLALSELLANEESARRLGREARKTVEAHYSIDRVVDRYVELYDQLTRQAA
jgi:glycosyltransferase involved in cell wall biosynthesis